MPPPSGDSERLLPADRLLPRSAGEGGGCNELDVVVAGEEAVAVGEGKTYERATRGQWRGHC